MNFEQPPQNSPRSHRALRGSVVRFLSAAFEHRRYRRFIVLTRSRTGSNMLISCLLSHPAVHAESEIFQRLNGRSSREILEGVFCRRPRGIRAAGFKIFYYHPLDDERKEVWDLLQAMPGLHVIHLKRRNILRTLVSRKIAGELDVWSSLEEKKARPGSDKRVELTAAELRDGFTQTRTWERDFEEMFRGKPTIEVTYEDFVDRPEVEFRRITDFLGLPFHPPQSEFRRQNPEPLRDLIRNYDDLKREF
ncbi:MAG: sulfotransferase, partial [Acidobacteria bacterium]|nr:sulfotransferase [Acidobacteriota bacterium]